MFEVNFRVEYPTSRGVCQF